MHGLVAQLILDTTPLDTRRSHFDMVIGDRCCSLFFGDVTALAEEAGYNSDG